MEAVTLLDAQWPLMGPLVFAVIGAVFGSFIGCALYRVPRGLSLRHPPSHCPACRTRLGIADLVPVLSWVVFRGHCRHCRAQVPIRYTLVETTSVLMGLTAWFTGRPDPWLLVTIFAALLCLQFAVLLYLFERKLAGRVLLFSLMLVASMVLLTLR